MIQISKDELREMLNEVYSERENVNAEDHASHHAWLQSRIEAEKERKAMYREITRVVIQWSIPVIMGSSYLWIKSHWSS